MNTSAPGGEIESAFAEQYYLEIGRRVRSAREHCGITQEVLAHAIGLSRTSLTNIECGRQKILVHTLNQIASLVGVSIQELLPVSGKKVEASTMGLRSAAPAEISFFERVVNSEPLV